jgi:alpha,alpha-trehalase
MIGPRHLLDAWPVLRRAFVDPCRVALFTDFDGTLVRIQRRPGGVRLSRSLRRLLGSLARAGAVVGVISGRRLADARARVGVRGIWYAGVHGYFLQNPANRGFALLNPTTQALIRSAGRKLVRRLRGTPGIVVEEKGATVAVHYRGASRKEIARARAAVARCREAEPGLHWMEGKKVWELFPAHEVDKWAAIQFILRRERKVSPSAGRTLVYLGDDTTDERVFRRMRGISVAVGKRHRTAARFFLRSPAEVRQFLERVETSWK